MKSVARPVLWVAPWFQLVVMAATFTPRPTCAGLVPPRFCAAAPPARMTCDRVSWKTVWLPLKPTVLTLAMLLPVTSSLVWWARRPEIAENMERNMGRSSSVVGSPDGGGRRGAGRGSGGLGRRSRGAGDLGEAADGDLLAVDGRRGLVLAGRQLDRGHYAGHRLAVLVGVGGGAADQRPGGRGLLHDEHRGVLLD